MLTSPELLHRLEIRHEQLKDENFELKRACDSVHKQLFELLEEVEVLYQILEQHGIEVTIHQIDDNEFEVVDEEIEDGGE